MKKEKKTKGFSVRLKIIGLGAVSILLSILVVAFISLKMAEDSIEQEAINKLDAVKTIKLHQIKRFFQEIDRNANVFAANLFISSAIKNLDDLSKEAKERGLLGKKLLDYPPFKREFDKYYGYVKKYLENFGYYDIFLFTPNSGRIVLTVALESDFGTEMKHETSHLAKAWQKMKAEKKMVMTDIEPYAPSNGDPAMFIVEPAYDKGKYIGAIGYQVPVGLINKIMQERTGMGKTGESFLVGSDKRMRSDSFEDKEGHSVAASFKGSVEKNGNDTEASRHALAGKTGFDIVKDTNGDEVIASYAPLDFFGLRWAVISKMDMAEIDQPVAALRNYVVVFSAVIICAAIFIFFLVINRSIINPILHIKEVTAKIAKGDLTASVNVTSSDEIGELSASFNEFIKNIHGMVEQIILSSQNLAQAVEQIASGNQNLSQRVSEQASSLEEVASTVEQATATTNQNTESAGKANSLATNTLNIAEEGGTISREAVNGINEINDVSKKIGDITNVINEISFQTNLLALNAAVEAARAGEAGRGFAVVAGEIRNLAQRSGNAAKEIEELIKNTVVKIEKGSGLVIKSGDSLTEIIKAIGDVNNIVGEITMASSEQKQGMDQLTIAISELDNMTQQNAALVEETASASEEMSNQAQELLGMTEVFNINGGDKRLKKESLAIKQHTYQQVEKGGAAAEKDGNGKKGQKQKQEALPEVTAQAEGSIKKAMVEEGFEEF